MQQPAAAPRLVEIATLGERLSALRLCDTDRRHGQASTAVTSASNIALSERGRYLGDATLTAAILERLAMHAIRIDISGPSFRQHVATRRAGRMPPT